MSVTAPSGGVHPSWPALLVSLLLLAALVLFVGWHLGEARHFAALIEQARPLWLLVAAGCQILTYVCAGAIWGRVAAAGGHRFPLPQLARLSVEKLTVDQLVPAGGLAGNAVVARALHRLGAPSALAAEALIVDIVSFYGAFAILVVLALGVLWIHHGIDALVIGLLVPFAAIVAAVPLAIGWVLRHRGWRPGPRLARVALVRQALELLGQVSPDRVWSRGTLFVTMLLQAVVFLLDAVTLWAVLRALGIPADLLTAFVAVVIAGIAAIVSLLPGGIGTFEAGAVTTLHLLGVPVEAALSATLVLRGMTLWLPLIPGLWLARRELGGRRDATSGAA